MLQLKTLLAHLTAHPLQGRLWIAYSGGMDSHVLLHAVAQLRPQLPVTALHAVHIHHGLQAAADEWAIHCQHTSAALDIPCTVLQVNAQPQAGESPEARARTARYHALQTVLASGESVLLAQHADDQAETLLLQLLRGAGTAGLAAMPVRSALGQAWKLRPLLPFTRADLLAYAHAQQLHWVEDPSNADTRYDRNFLRHQIAPALSHRWPAFAQTLSRAAQHQADAHQLLQCYLADDWQRCRAAADNQLFINALQQFEPVRQRHIVRYWLAQLQLPMPSTVKLTQILTEVIAAEADRQPCVQWTGAEVRRYRDVLYALLPQTPPPANWSCTWDLQHPLKLPKGYLVANRRQGVGLQLPEGEQVTVCLRQGGESWYWRGHHHKLKKQVQALPLPTWERGFLPLVYWQDQLVMVPFFGVSDGVRVRGEDWGWVIGWEDLSFTFNGKS